MTSKNATPAQGSASAMKAPEVPVAAKRISRIPVDAIREALTGHEVLVSTIAEKLKIGERDVRLGIDKLRKGKITVVRTALKTFSIPVSAAKSK